MRQSKKRERIIKPVSRDSEWERKKASMKISIQKTTITKATMKPNATKGSQHVRGVTQNPVEIIEQSEKDFKINVFKINTQKSRWL